MLPISHRLKGKKIFNDIFRLGKTFSNDVMLMKVVLGEKGQPAKFGFAASLKFSKKAVERNKAKRWMREAVRARIKDVRLGKEIVFLINPKFPKEKLSLELIRENIEKLLKQAKIL
ncbi:MAG: ribonuclease P protein component [Candidatus Moranbacteria bacterium]|nr:ribonuclease P protein component [Candidatus Moranbacteria bacterium]